MNDETPTAPTGPGDPPAFEVDVTVERTMHLSVRDIWPDGDAPANPTAKDVIAKIRQTTTGPHDLIRAWGLDDDLVVRVDDDRPVQQRGRRGSRQW